MDKYLNNINTSGSNLQRYKRCIYNIIKDVNENITIFHSNVSITKENQKQVTEKITQITNHDSKYCENFSNINKIIQQYSEMYTSYLVKIDDIVAKINLMTTLKKIKEKHVTDAYNYLQTIDQYRDELKKIDSSIDYGFIDDTFRKVQEEQSEISLINNLMGDIENTKNEDMYEVSEHYYSESDDGDLDDFM